MGGALNDNRFGEILGKYLNLGSSTSTLSSKVNKPSAEYVALKEISE